MAPLTTWLLTALVGLANGLASTDTITWGGDNSRAGYQTTHNMDPSVVGSSQFGQLFRTQLPGNYGGQPEQIFSQPLVYTPSGGDGTQYVYVATQQNNVYKINAKTGAIIASRNLHIPFLTADLDGCIDVNPHVGITATGVIDPSTDTLYLTSKTYADQSKPNVAQGRPAGRYYIHALDVNTLQERPNFPVNLEGTVARNNPIRSFNGGIHHQRPALLNVGQFVYLGFASHCVQYNFTGWIIGFDKTSGNLVERWATQGDGVPNTVPGAGVWMSGGGLASDDAGSMFFATGNGYASQLSTIPVNGRQPPTAMEEAAVHMSIGGDGSLTVTDFFMPWEKQALDGADKDLGTSPLQILPSAFSCGDVRRIGVVTGKSGKTYWINLDNMGGYRNGANRLDAVIQVYQNDNSVYAGAGVYPLEGGYIFINVINYPTNVFKFSCTAGVPSFTKVAMSPAANAAILGVSHGTVTSLNNQPGTGLIWTLDVQGSQLRIYDAIPKNNAMNLIKSFSVPGSTKFGRAVFGDGIMYQGTTLGYLYAFGSPVNVPVNCTSSNDFGTVNVGNQSVARSISCKALIGVTVTDIGLDEADDFVITNAGSLPLTLTAGQTFNVSVTFKPTTVGLVSSDLLVNTTNAVAGYSQNTHVRLTGTGESSSPLLAVTPPTVTFQGIIAGSNGTLEETVIISNQGNVPLSITNIQFSTTSAQGPFTTWNHETDTLTVGKFTLSNIPATIDPNSAVTVDIAFDSSVAGSFGAYLTVNSNGGSKSFTIAGSAGPAPVALIEFQTPDATGWVQYDASKNFTFGNVTENTSRSLKFRVTNNAAAGGVNLILTVSKPPFGIPGIVGAANQVDLAEGTQLAPGESATATMICSVPKSQWNVDSYVGTAPWTMNTNDPTFEKHFFTFVCNAVSEQAPPLLPSGQGKYRYIGCFKENNPGRQLPNQLAGGATNTNPSCIANCAAKNYVFCGTQYHTECWGGPTIPKLKVDDKNCNYDCGGDLNQICGGNGVGDIQGPFISVFADSTQWDGNTTTPTPNPTNPTNPSGPVVNPGVGQYVSAGCYTEGTNGRALPNLVNVQTQTVGNCITACAAKKYTWIGVEYGGECWCGNTLGAGAVPALAADCSMACNGNSSEYCGGPNRLNMYTLNTSLPVPSSSSSTAASLSTGTGTATSAGTGTVTSTSTSAAATTTAANSRIGDWLFQGCWTEGTGVRALPVRTYANDSMTLQSCSGFCQGLKYFGTEYGRECWCGNVLDATSKQAPLTDCSFPCPGDSTQKCGAGNRLQLYMYSPVASSSTAATSSSSVTIQDKAASTSTSSTLSGSSSSSTVSSPSSSTTSLSSSTSSTPGLIPGAFTSTSDSSSSSTLMTSSSSSSATQSTDSSASSSSSTSTSTSLSTSSSTAVPSSTTASTSSSTSDVTAAGVSTTSSSSSTASSSSTLSSSSSSSSFTPSSSSSSSSTVSSSSSSTISSISSSSIFSAASVSSTASSSSSSSSSQASSSSSTSSSSSSTLSSSASSTLTSSSSSASSSSTATSSSLITSSSSTSTFKSSSSSTSSSTSSAKPTPTGPVIVPGDQNFTYYGCFSEPQVGRLLPTQVVNDAVNMTINKCLSACSDKLYAGVEYGRECWCGNTLNYGGSGGTKQAANVSSSDCSFKCPGNSTQYCGAGVRLNLYILRTEYARLQNQAGTSP